MQQIIKIVKYLLFLFWISLGGLVLPSCKKFLDKKTNTNLTLINTVEDLQAIMDNNGNINEATPPYGEASSDDYFSLQPNEGIGENGRLAYTWQFFTAREANSIANDWATCYLPVNLANICLEKIDQLPQTPDNILQWNNVKGSALFIRAFNFLNLSWIYSKAYDKATSANDPGIALRLGTDYNQPTVRASVEESYEQVIRDAKESLLYLPAIPAHSLRPSKAAAYGLLARAYLSMRLYDSAGIYADSCLQIRNELINYNGDPDIVNDINGTNSPFRQYNKETIFYACMISNLLNALLYNGNMDTTLYLKYAPDDIRKVAFVTPGNNGYFKFKGNYTQSASLHFGGIATDEMFLIRAEAYARKEMVQEAMSDLNTLLIKRWKNTVPYPVVTATDPINALQKILDERRKELVFRGLRWPDIKRLNKEGVGIVLKRIVEGENYELSPNNDKYALPIPKDIIQLTGIAQNIGWQ